MPKLHSLAWRTHPASLNYAVAVLSVALALLIARLLQIKYGWEPYNAFLCAILFTALFGGVGPGLLAVGLSLTAFEFFLLPPMYAFGIPADLPRLAVAAVTALFIVLLCAAQRGAAEALRESEERFRQITGNMWQIFWMATPRIDEVLYVSPAYERIFGRSLESLRRSPRSFLDAIHGDDRERVARIVEEQRETGFETEFRVVRPDGSVRWIRDRGFPVRDQSGKLYRVAGIAEDITERKHAEDHLRLVIDTIPTMAWSLLPDGTVDFVNQRWLKYTGFSPDEALEKATGIVHPEDLPGIMEKWAVNMAAGESAEDEMRLRGADGEYRWFLVRTMPLADAQGNIVKWYGTSTDIEDRKRAEDALRQSEEKFRQLAENIREVFWMTTPAMEELLYVSPAYESIWGRPMGSLRQWRSAFIEAIHPEDRGRVAWIVDRQRQQGFDVEYRIVRPDGSISWIRDRGFPVRDGFGQVYRIAGIAEDITERKDARDAVRRSAGELQALSRRLVELQESERKELARELHDRVGQGLTALNINLAILRQRLAGQDADVLSRLEDSAGLVKSSMHAIENLLSDLRPQMLDDHGLRAALEWYSRQFAARAGITVAVRAGEQEERMTSEVEIALFRIAQEALNNVAKHSRATSVEIVLGRMGLDCVMSVTDNGIGSDAAADAAYRKRPGLGVVTMRERAQAVGGRFDIELRPGGGTQLTVAIPNDRRAPQAVHANGGGA